MGKLTDSRVKSVKLPEGKKELKISDGDGLFLLIKQLSHGTVGKYWKLAYRFGDKQKKLSIGIYPDLSLKEARERVFTAKRQLSDGIDPSAHKKANKLLRKEAGANSFENLAREWHSKQKPTWSEGHASRVLIRLEQDIFPHLGVTPISEITPPTLLMVLKRIESRGAIETAHRIKQSCGQIFRYAVAHGLAERDPTPDLKDALAPVISKSFATITDPVKIGELLRAIDSYEGSNMVRAALQLAPLVFVRPGNLRSAKWEHVDLDSGLWIIPASELKLKQSAKMQTKNDHVVPLATQAVDILRALHPETGHLSYLFPSVRAPKSRPMSDNTINAALRRMGFDKEAMTGHGFRHMASTRLNEMGYSADIIEKQLAHKEGNKIRAIYNKAEYLDERINMMQAWADYLDTLKQGGKVLLFQKQHG